MFRKLILAALAIPFLTACAVYQASAQTITPEQASRIGATCTRIMGLRKGEWYYDACQDSLSRSLAGKQESEATLQAYDDCHRHGLAQGSPAFSACVLGKQNAFEAHPRWASAATNSEGSEPFAFPEKELQSGESYYNVTPSMHWRREQYSCAQLGFTPGSNAFGECVAHLDSDMLPPN